jgi:hypothetical protein
MIGRGKYWTPANRSHVRARRDSTQGSTHLSIFSDSTLCRSVDRLPLNCDGKTSTLISQQRSPMSHFQCIVRFSLSRLKEQRTATARKAACRLSFIRSSQTCPVSHTQRAPVQFDRHTERLLRPLGFRWPEPSIRSEPVRHAHCGHDLLRTRRGNTHERPALRRTAVILDIAGARIETCALRQIVIDTDLNA